MLRAALSAAVLAVGVGALPGTGDRAGWRSLLHWPAACERDWRAGGSDMGSGISTWRTAGGRTLVEVSCFLGAYQGTSMLYLAGPGRRVTGPLVLRTYRDTGSGKPTPHRETVVLGTLAFSRGVLTVLDKFRGLGDCGIFSSFRLDGGRLRTIEVRAKTACDGKPPYDPRRWPRLPLPH